MQVLHQTGQDFLQARVGRGFQTGYDGLGDGVLIEVAQFLLLGGSARERKL